MEGWIKLHRELLDKAIWKCATPQQKVILVTILLLANHKASEWEFKGKKYIVQPGQFITSLEKLCDMCGKGVAMGQLRTSLKKFVDYEVIEIESTKSNTLVTVVNWGKYQHEQQTDDKPITNQWQTDNKPITNQWQTNDKPMTTNKNNKNENNKKNFKNYKNDKEYRRVNKFANFVGRDYDFETYERLEMERQLKEIAKNSGGG